MDRQSNRATMGKGGGNIPSVIGGGAVDASSGGGGDSFDGSAPRRSPGSSGAATSTVQRMFFPPGSIAMAMPAAAAGGSSRADGGGEGSSTERAISDAAANSAVGDTNGSASDSAHANTSSSSKNSDRNPASTVSMDDSSSCARHGSKRRHSGISGEGWEGDREQEDEKSSKCDETAENGFLVLDDCVVTVACSDDDKSHTSTGSNDGFANLELGKWADLAFTSRDSHKELCCCNRCNVILTQSSDTTSNPLHIDPTSVVRFNGKMADMKTLRIQTPMTAARKGEEPETKQLPTVPCSPNCTATLDENRSDASLLLGLVLQCKDLGSLLVRSSSIVLHCAVDEIDCKNDCSNEDDERKPSAMDISESDQYCSGSSSSGSSRTTRSCYRQYRASIVLTVFIKSESKFSNENESNPPRKRARRSSSATSRRKSKQILSPPVQLLLALIRCDWSNLELHKRMQLDLLPNIDENKSSVEQRRKATLFPPILSLGELYKRIRGARSHNGGNPILKPTNEKTGASGPICPFSNDTLLPEEVLITKLAPFLSAKSLYSLRCASTRLHVLLRAVVPGLKLRLFRHQVNSLTWMLRREIRGFTEADTLLHDHAKGAAFAEDDLVGGDYHRAATGGSSVLLSQRQTRDTSPAISRRIAGLTGMPIDNAAPSHMSKLRKFARGGLLCDDPGLGKTVTVLSLILQTFGQSTERERTPSANNSFSTEEEIFRSYWREGLTSFGRTPELLRLVNRLRRVDEDSAYFEFPINASADGAADYYDIIKTPICMRDILSKINVSGYGDDFERLTSDIDLCFRNAMLYNPPGHRIYEAAEKLSNKFKELVSEFKAEQTRKARKAFSSISARPDSSVAAILAEKANNELLDSLYPSSGTLLIVPNPLLQHWEDQMSMHIDVRYCTSKTPLIFRLGKKRKASHTLEEVHRLSRIDKTHYPFLFVDEGTMPLPPPEFLAMFAIVLTTNQRIKQEWKFGSVEEELNITNRKSSRGDGRHISYRTFFDDSMVDIPPPSPLLKVHWLRLIVDEGHSMSRSTNSNTFQFGQFLTAQRRWAITGTPTQQTASQSGLRNVHCLFQFLKHQVFSAKLNGDQIWNDLISRSWNDGCLVSFFRLRMMLSLFMVRHTKSDIEEIPPPIYKKINTSMSRQELMSYNTLVSAAQMNVKTTSMKGKTSGWQDSLLNPRQSKHARKSLENIRLACCGGVHVLPNLEDRFRIMTIQMLRMKHNLDDVRVQVVDNYMGRATSGELSSCMSCGIQVQTLFVVPCGCLVCTECIDSDINICPNCSIKYDVDDFQLLQPGMNYEWSLSLKEEQRKRENEANRRRQLNDAQSGGVDGGNGDGDGEVDVVVGEANQNENEERDADNALAPPNAGPIDLFANLNGEGSPSRNRWRLRNHQCTFSKANADGKCLVCREEHFDCNFMADGSTCSLCFKKAEECPDTASKALLVTNKLLHLRQSEICGKRSTKTSTAASIFLGENVVPSYQRPLKVIVFSQFRELLNYVGDRLIRRFGGSCVAEYWGSTRAKELSKFIHSPSCFCMLLGKEGSHGLDLSMVTNIMLLDELFDKSLKEQVVARAYRMGATGRVVVEQLIARDSVEELVAQMNDDSESAANDNLTQGDEQKKANHAKIHFLLKNVRLAGRGLAASNTPNGDSLNSDKKSNQMANDCSSDRNDVPGNNNVKERPRVRFGS